MTTEEIKNECIQRGEYTMSKFTPKRANAQIAFYAITMMVPILFPLMFLSSPFKNNIFEAPTFVIVFLSIYEIGLCVAAGTLVLKQLKKILMYKEDTITFDKRGISYNGSDECMPERLFNLKWDEISNVEIKGQQTGRGVSFDYVIYTTDKKRYEIDNLTEGGDFAVNDFMWLTNYFSRKEVFNAEKMKKLSERSQPTISWSLIVLCCIASLLLTYSILLDYPSLTKMMNGIELFIANTHILAPLFIVISISAFALEFVIAKRKDSRYQLLSLRSFIHFATCFVLTIILTLSLFIILT